MRFSNIFEIKICESDDYSDDYFSNLCSDLTIHIKLSEGVLLMPFSIIIANQILKSYTKKSWNTIIHIMHNPMKLQSRSESEGNVTLWHIMAMLWWLCQTMAFNIFYSHLPLCRVESDQNSCLRFWKKSKKWQKVLVFPNSIYNLFLRKLLKKVKLWIKNRKIINVLKKLLNVFTIEYRMHKSWQSLLNSFHSSFITGRLWHAKHT